MLRTQLPQVDGRVEQQHGAAALLRVLETSRSRFPTRPPRCLPAAVERVPEKSPPGHELIGRSAVDIGDAQAARLVIRLQHESHTYRFAPDAVCGHRSPGRSAPTDAD